MFESVILNRMKSNLLIDECVFHSADTGGRSPWRMLFLPPPWRHFPLKLIVQGCSYIFLGKGVGAITHPQPTHPQTYLYL